jgi:hypothetical protein
MNKEDRRFVIEGTLKALVSFIPGIGGAIGSILSDTLADRKEQRISELLSELKTEIDAQKESVNESFISKGDFLDIFEATVNKVANERSEQKRIAFRNILLTGILSTQYSYDDVEFQMRILEQLNQDHILLLRLFKTPKNFVTEDKDSYKSNTLLRLFRQILPNWDVDYIFDSLNDLQNMRLIESITSNWQTMMTSVTLETLEGKLTSKGMTFVMFILR